MVGSVMIRVRMIEKASMMTVGLVRTEAGVVGWHGATMIVGSTKFGAGMVMVVG